MTKNFVKKAILYSSIPVMSAGLISNAYSQNNKPDFVKDKDISFWSQEFDGRLDSLGVVRLHDVDYFVAKDSGENKLGFKLYPIDYCGMSKMVGSDKKIHVSPELEIDFSKIKVDGKYANSVLLADTGKFATHSRSLGDISSKLDFDNNVASKSSINGEGLFDIYTIKIRDDTYLIPFRKDSLTKKEGASNFVAIKVDKASRTTNWKGENFLNSDQGIYRGYVTNVKDSSILKQISKLYPSNYPANSVVIGDKNKNNNTGQANKFLAGIQQPSEAKEEKAKKKLNLEGRIVLGVVGAVRTFNEENFNANQADAYVALQLKTGEIWVGPYAEGAFAGSKIITNQLDTVGAQRKLIAYNVYKNNDSLVNTNTKISYPYEAGIAIQGDITEGLGYLVSAGVARENSIVNKYGEKNIWYERNGSILDRAKITNNTTDKHSSWVPTVGIGLQKHLFNNKVDLEVSGKYLNKPMFNAAIKFNLSNSKRK